MLINVDLPAPFSPTMPWMVPAFTARQTSRFACTAPKALLMWRSSMASGVSSAERPREISVVEATENPAGRPAPATPREAGQATRSDEHTSELQSLMRISYAVFCLQKKRQNNDKYNRRTEN